MRIWRNAHLATMADERLGIIEDGAVAVEDGRIAWVGRAVDAPAGEAVDCRSARRAAGLVDCRTHLVFGGDRAAECEQRLTGASHEAIARGGRGHPHRR